MNIDQYRSTCCRGRLIIGTDGGDAAYLCERCGRHTEPKPLTMFDGEDRLPPQVECEPVVDEGDDS